MKDRLISNCKSLRPVKVISKIRISQCIAARIHAHKFQLTFDLSYQGTTIATINAYENGKLNPLRYHVKHRMWLGCIGHNLLYWVVLCCAWDNPDFFYFSSSWLSKILLFLLTRCLNYCSWSFKLSFSFLSAFQGVVSKQIIQNKVLAFILQNLVVTEKSFLSCTLHFPEFFHILM